MVGRGVRRVFVIDLPTERVVEWEPIRGRWIDLDPTGYIPDAALEVPLPVHAMLHRAKADDHVAQALLLKRNPVFEAVRVEDRVEGEARDKARALLRVLEARGLPIAIDESGRILAERNAHQLDRWIAGAIRCASMAELLAV